MKILRNGVRKYLSIAGFNKMSENSCYLKRNHIDILASFLYSSISIGCVICDEASLLVLFLNGLCMARVIVKNTIKSSELTDAIREELKLDKQVVLGRYYYFIKALMQVSISFMVAIIVVAMGFDTSLAMVKAPTIVIIVFIFLDDLENMWINLYEAYIDPFCNNYAVGGTKNGNS